jgi:hypothetical protein
MRQLKYILAALFVLSLSMSFCSALDTERVFRLSFDHLLYMSNISTSPLEIYPGQEANISFQIENTGDQFIRDIRINLDMPAEFAPYRDINRRKIAQMDAGSSETISFNILPLPKTEDGVYKLNIIAQYINYVGDEREENNTISIIVGSSPKLLAELSSSDIYKGNNLGNVKIKVINNNVGNVKFLQVNLADSEDYTILGSSMDYVGDLNSDDFSDVSFKISVNDNAETIELPITLLYKDALNKDYTQEVKVQFKIPTAAEAGIKTSSSGLIVIIVIIAIVGFIIYRRYNKNIMKQKKALTHSFNTKF